MLLNFIIKILLYIWQLPQHILALILLAIYKPKEKQQYKRSTVHILHKGNFAVSLGEHIFIHKDWLTSKNIIPHEYGHTIQSYMFGPLYLIVIGIPSIVQNILSSYFHKRGNSTMLLNYYNRFPENWADTLGGVKRS